MKIFKVTCRWTNIVVVTRRRSKGRINNPNFSMINENSQNKKYSKLISRTPNTNHAHQKSITNTQNQYLTPKTILAYRIIISHTEFQSLMKIFYNPFLSIISHTEDQIFSELVQIYHYFSVWMNCRQFLFIIRKTLSIVMSWIKKRSSNFEYAIFWSKQR